MIHQRTKPVPPSIVTETADVRRTQLGRWLSVAAGAAHFTAAVGFTALHQWPLGVASGAAAVGLLLTAYSLRASLLPVVALIGFVAAFLHIGLWSIALGSPSGAHHYFLILALIAATARDILPRVALRLFSLGGAILWLALGLASLPTRGFLVPPPSAETLNLLNALNLVGVAFLSIAINTRASFAFLDSERKLADATRISQKLLFETLPRPIAERLMKQRGTIATRHEAVTILFVDLVGFTSFSSSRTPEAVVKLLEEWFLRLDRLAVRHGVEKIKTIGDAWMGVAGVPEPASDHADRTVALAGAILREVAEVRKEYGEGLSVRIGVHSGPVVAGVLGQQRPQYDVWGDTVNTASRLESQGIPGHAQISAATRAALIQPVALVHRGEVDLRGKGKVDVWLGTGDTIPARTQVRTKNP